MTMARRGSARLSAKTTARILSAPGKPLGKRRHRGIIRWRCAQPTKKTTRSRMNRCGTPAATCGTASSARKWWWAMPAEGSNAMKNRAVAIFVAACGVGLAAGVVYADLKKGYYAPEQLGSIQQAAPAALSP